jgi:C-terminal processing protease CtpA/Prc
MDCHSSGSPFKEYGMRVTWGILACLIGVWVWGATTRAAAVPAQENASYEGLEPGVFMKRWLVCGPFPVVEGPNQPDDPAVQRQAFYRDFLTEHGGEAEIQPTPQMVHHRDGKEYPWRLVTSPENIIDLAALYGPKDYVTAYAWAEIDMPAAKTVPLGVGSDDAVRIWLNGEAVFENWTDRPAREDDDLVLVHFRAGKNHLLMKVQNGRELWGFVCRLLDGRTLADKFFAALGNGDAAVAQICLSYGADINAKDKYGFTALQVARARGQEDMVKLLLSKGADPNAAMPPAATPLGFLDILWRSLKENYPMMEYAGAFDESWYEACQQKVKDANNLYQALPVMDAMLVRRLNDYHTSMFWEGKDGLIPPPVRLERIEGQLVVTESPQELGIARGDIVVEIDGSAAGERFDQEFPHAFGATPYAKARSACEEILKGKPGSEVKLKLRDAGGALYEKVLQRGGGGYGSERGPVLSSRVIDERIGYIRIRGWGGFSPDEFDKLLEPLREKPCLILDVRDNGGGADALAETVIGRFITHKVLASVGFQRRAGTDLYEKIVFVVEPRGPWCYGGKVAVLINEGCASACEHFVSGMFEAGALLVGTPTTGACGWSKNIDLPAGVSLRCSLTFPLHGKVPSPLHGIEPHHLVTPTIADLRAGRDTVLEKALELLKP